MPQQIQTRQSSPGRQSTGAPSASQTIDDILVSGLAAHNARFQKKMMDADRDVAAYRARMNALANAQAQVKGLAGECGADTVAGPENTGYQVYTNSPITNYPSPIVIQPPIFKSVAAFALAALAILAIAFLFWCALQKIAPPGPTPAPAPATGGQGDLHIDVIRGDGK
jgi:hypothetical protein